MNWIVQGGGLYATLFVFLLLPGLLIQLNLANWFPNRFRMDYGVGRFLLNGFLLSLLLNGAVVVMVSLTHSGLDTAKYLLLILDALALLAIFIARFRGAEINSLLPVIKWRSEWLFALVVVIVFITMAVQGGLLDIMADGWWHMAYANSMVSENSLFIQNHPLVGTFYSEPKILYPPLWHLQLALVSEVSGVSLPVIWHFVAALNIVMLLIAFYLLAWQLTQDRATALLAVILHLFLVGGLNSYFRIGSWPGNVSYVFLYYAFYLTFLSLHELGVWRQHHQTYRNHVSAPLVTLGYLALSCLTMVGLHGVELVLFVSGIGSYLLAIIYIDMSRGVRDYLTDRVVLSWVFLICFFLGAVGSFFLLPHHLTNVMESPRAQEPYLNFIIPLLILLSGVLGIFISRYVNRKNKGTLVKVICLAVIVLFVVAIVDFDHLKSLFFPEIEGRHVPRDFFDRFNNRVYLPFWDHQLRGALLFNGVLSIVLGVIMLFLRPSRVAIFTGANAILVFIVLASPYLFTFMSFLIPLPSVYRIQLLLFSPLIIAVFLRMMWSDYLKTVRL